MWDAIGQLGQTIIVISTIAAAAVSGIFWGDRKRLIGRLSEERIQNDRSIKRIQILENDLTQTETKNERLVNQLEAVTAIKTNETAIAAVTENLTKLSTTLDEHHTATEDNWTEQTKLMAAVISELTKVTLELHTLIEVIGRKDDK